MEFHEPIKITDNFWMTTFPQNLFKSKKYGHTLSFGDNIRDYLNGFFLNAFAVESRITQNSEFVIFTSDNRIFEISYKDVLNQLKKELRNSDNKYAKKLFDFD